MLDEIGSHLLRLKGKHKFHSNLSISWVLFNSGWYIVLDIPSPKPLFTVSISLWNQTAVSRSALSTIRRNSQLLSTLTIYSKL